MPDQQRDRPTLVIHIGHYKTGTTALQIFLAQNAALLAERGVHYQQGFLRNGKHSYLALTHLEEGGAQDMLFGNKPEAPALTEWDKVLDEARALGPGQTLIISSEEFIRIGAHPGAVDLLNQVAARAQGIDVRVIAYLRAPAEHLESWHNQLIKLGFPVPGFEATVLTQLERVHWDYGAALQPWADAFGPQALVVRGYHRGLREGDALFRSFFDALGLPYPSDAHPPGRDPNPRLDPRIADLLRAASQQQVPRWQRQHIETRAREALELLDMNIPDPQGELARVWDEARAGLDAVARLPGARIDPDALLARPLSGPSQDERRLSETVAMLMAEIADLRATVTTLRRKVDEMGKKRAQGQGKAKANTASTPSVAPSKPAMRPAPPPASGSDA